MDSLQRKSINGELNLLSFFLISKIKDYIHEGCPIAHEYIFVDKAKGKYGVFSFQSIARYLCLNVDQWRDRIETARKEGKRIQVKNQRFNFV